MISFLLALQYLTVIPVKIRQIKVGDIGNSMIYFPLVGLLLGFILSGVSRLLFTLDLPQLSIDIILVVTLIIFTGALHLDGLSDTFDAFLSRKNKQGMLEIMRDSHAGVMGILAIISVILLKISFLFSIDSSVKSAALLSMCILSRFTFVFLIYLFPYARQEGKLKVFRQEINLKILLYATAITVISIAVIWKIKGLLLLILIPVCACSMGKFIDKKIGGITGDTLGAIGEITEVIVLFGIISLDKISL